MSGVEVLGIATAVLQIADLGGRVSVRLFGFARKIKGAAEKIDLISREIAATGALLQQLGQQLNKDSQAQLLRPELIHSANGLVCKCKEIFKNIDGAIDGNSGNKIILSLKQKIQYAYLESEIDTLRTHLETLKGSISIMQNILIYAEQLRNRERFPVLQEQRALLEALGDEKFANEQRYNTLMVAIKERPYRQATTSPSARLLPDQPSNVHTTWESGPRQLTAEGLQTSSQSPLPTPADAPLALNDRKIRDYNSLVARMLQEIHSKHYDLDGKMRSRAHGGVLDLHWREWAPFRQVHGDDVLLKKLTHLPQLYLFWVKKIEEQEVLQQQHHHQQKHQRQHQRWAHGSNRKLKIKISSSKDDDQVAQNAITPIATLTPRYGREEMEKKLNEVDGPPLRLTTEMKVQHAKEAEEPRDSQLMRKEIAKQNDLLLPTRGRPTYTKAKRSHLSEDTLNFHQLPWEIDATDPEYFLIKKYVNHDLMEELFRDTKERRAQAAQATQQEDVDKLPDWITQPMRPRKRGRRLEHYYTRPARFREDAVPSSLSAFQFGSAVADPDVDSYGDENCSEMSFPVSEIQGQARYKARSAAPPPWEFHSLLEDGAMPDLRTCVMGDHSEPRLLPSQGQATYEAESAAAPPSKPSFDIQSLLSQWTTLSPHEIALGDDQSGQLGP